MGKKLSPYTMKQIQKVAKEIRLASGVKKRETIVKTTYKLTHAQAVAKAAKQILPKEYLKKKKKTSVAKRK